MKSSQQQQQQQQLPPSQDENHLFNSLCLLGLTPQVAAKHGVEIHRLMFRKPNTKAMELILYWLYGICKGKSYAKKEFKNVWPIIDSKMQKEFHQKIQDWFRELKQTGDLEIMANSTISALRNAQGTRLVSLLSELSHVALYAHHAALFPDDARNLESKAMTDKDARALLPLEKAIMVIAEQNVQEQYQQFLALTQQANALQKESEDVAATLLNHYYDRAAYIKKLQSMQPAPAAPEVHKARIDNMHRAEQLWRSLEQQLSLFPAIMELLKGITGSATHPNAIDGFMLTELSMETGAGRPALSRTQSRPADTDLCSLLKVWMLQLEQLGTQVKELAGMGAPGARISPLASGSGGDSHLKELVGNSHLHKMNLMHLQELKTRLANDLTQADQEAELLKTAVQEAVVAAQQKVAALNAGMMSNRRSSEADGIHMEGQPTLPPVPRTPMPSASLLKKSFPFMSQMAGITTPSLSLGTIPEAAQPTTVAAPSPMDPPTSGTAFSPSPLLAPSGFPPAPLLDVSPAGSPQDVNMTTPADARRLDFSTVEIASPDLPFGNRAAAHLNGVTLQSSLPPDTTPVSSSLPACVSTDSPNNPGARAHVTPAGPIATPPEAAPMLSPLLTSADSPMLWLLSDPSISLDMGESIDVTLSRMKHAGLTNGTSNRSADVSGALRGETRTGVRDSGEDNTMFKASYMKGHYDVLASLELLNIGNVSGGVKAMSSSGGRLPPMKESDEESHSLQTLNTISSSAKPANSSTAAVGNTSYVASSSTAVVPLQHRNEVSAASGGATDGPCDMDVDSELPSTGNGAHAAGEQSAELPQTSGAAFMRGLPSGGAGDGQGASTISGPSTSGWSIQQPVNTALSQLLEAESSNDDLPSASESADNLRSSTATSVQPLVASSSHADVALARIADGPSGFTSSVDGSPAAAAQEVSSGGDSSKASATGAGNSATSDTQSNTLELLRQRFQNVKQKKADLLQGMGS